MQKAEESLAILNRLAELGLGISIDDFGTGYPACSTSSASPPTSSRLTGALSPPWDSWEAMMPPSSPPSSPRVRPWRCASAEGGNPEQSGTC